MKTQAQIDDEAVDKFAVAMKAKLAKKREQGYCGWDNDCSVSHLAELLIGHVGKGDPVDIGNFAMMIWNRVQTEPDRKSAITDALENALGIR